MAESIKKGTAHWRKNISWRKLWLLFAFGLTLLWGAAAWRGQSALMDGSRIWWLNDDAMISMRVADHFFQGHGLVWNVGQRVEGYTNLAWVLVMAGFRGLGFSRGLAPGGIYVLNLLCGLALLGIVLNLGRRLGLRTIFPSSLALLLILFGLEPIINHLRGLESLYLACTWLWLLSRVLRQRRLDTLTVIVASGLGLLRADGLVWAAALLLPVWMLNGGSSITLFKFLALGFPWAAQEGFRLMYYGRWIPNTAVLKMQAWPGRWEAGLSYLARFWHDYWITLIFVAVALIIPSSRQKEKRAAALAAVVPLLYLVWAGGDFMDGFRMMAAIPILAGVLALVGVWEIASTGLPRWIAGLACVLVLVSFPTWLDRIPRIMNPHPSAVDQVRLGIALGRAAPEGARLASAWGGRLFYFSGLEGVDLLGKNDLKIAALEAVPGAGPGHNKYDIEWSLTHYRPQLIHADFTPAGFRPGGLSAYNLALFTNKNFKEHCLPYPVVFSGNNTVFGCQW